MTPKMIRRLVDAGCTMTELDLLLEIERGQLVLVRPLAERWGTEKENIYTRLYLLRKKGMVRRHQHRPALTRRGRHVLKMVRLLVCGEAEQKG